MPRRRSPRGTSSLTNVLKEAIRDSGMPLPKLAHAVGISTPSLTRFMRGERSLSLPAVEKLMQHLGLVVVTPEGARPARTRK
jgi:hypothetical protein